MARLRMVSGFLGLAFLISCGGSSNKGSDAPSTPPPKSGGDDSNKGGGNDSSITWYGFVSKCLVDAEEIKVPLDNGSVAYTVKQTTKCSPLMSDKDLDALGKELDAWKQQTCPANVVVRNGTAGNFAGCSLKPFGAMNVSGNNQNDIQQSTQDPDNCVGKQGGNYASMNCG